MVSISAPDEISHWKNIENSSPKEDSVFFLDRLKISSKSSWMSDEQISKQSMSIFVNNLMLGDCSWYDEETYNRNIDELQIQAPIWYANSVRWFKNRDKMHIK